MKLRYTLRAAEELEAAVDWYEKQQLGLGIGFLDCVEAALNSILESPTIYPYTHDSFRRCLVKRFPYSIHFTVEDDALVLHAVFDNRRDPGRLP